MLNPAWVVRKKRMKTWAEANGVVVPSGLKMTPVCGKACTALIRRIQLKAFGPNAVTGKWDNKIKNLVTPKINFRIKALAVAKKEIGVKEHPPNSNSGPRVREYQSVTGAYNEPWCASFVAWSFKSVGHRLTGFNTAYVPDYVANAKAMRNGLVVISPKEVLPGDLACYDWQGDGVCDHIGIVSTRVSDGSFSAVEGNTSVSNDSNGGEVMLRKRSTNSVGFFIRVI